MDLFLLTERAMQIRQKFNEKSAADGTRPWTREEVMQGFVGDIGDLMKLVMAKDGLRHADNSDHKLAHELSDCLWSVLVLAKLYDVDLEKEFFATMNEIEAKLDPKRKGSRGI